MQVTGAGGVAARPAIPGGDPVMAWLLDGDPAIRWQVLRDLVGASPQDIEAERQRVALEGWGARLLEDGGWNCESIRSG